MLWNMAPKTCTAKALLGFPVICRLEVDASCSPEILDENVTPKGPKRKFDEENSSSDPDVWELRHIGQMSNIYVGAVRACFAIQQYKLQELQTV